ncbi:hypothetical protein CcI49_30105 [Frankia sp. CcI49]|nr:hypothetical protein CcI49_30105 [Frankia sp. CcI49]
MVGRGGADGRFTDLYRSIEIRHVAGLFKACPQGGTEIRQISCTIRMVCGSGLNCGLASADCRIQIRLCCKLPEPRK